MEYILSYDKSKIPDREVDDLSKKFCIDKRVAELLYARGIDCDEKLNAYLNPSLAHLHDPFLFEQMKAAVDLINKHISDGSTILIYGDYDVDGITATATLVKYFKSIGVDAKYFLPNRYEDGYGLTVSTLDKLIDKYHFNLLITVDCGITAAKEIEYLKNAGIDAIVTDHHEQGGELPDCNIINPKISKTYPFNELCGSGVALKLVQAMGGIDAIMDFLPLTALATIADIVDLLDENRVIVSLGLKNIDKLPVGIKKLMQKIGVKGEIKASDIAFKVAPKINASGRMGDAETSLLLYLEDNAKNVETYVDETLSYNIQRQELCNKVYNDVKVMLSNVDIYNTKVLILKSAEWDAGILGIVAARIAEEYNRVTILFSQQDDLLTGSCRSVNGINVHEILCACSNILTKFGGHTMAAGLSLNADNFDEFIARTNECILINLENADLIPTKIYDFDILQDEITTKLIEDIDRMEPCGHNNLRPVFKFGLKNAVVSPLKKFPEHLMLNYHNMTLLSFNSANMYYVLSGNTQCHILTDLYVETYKNNKKITGIVKSIDYDDIYRPNDNDVMLAEYIKQLTFQSDEKVKFSTYNREQLIRILLQMKKDVYGTLIVANDYNTYLNFKTIYGAENIIRNRLFEVGDQTGLNTIILAPKNFKHFNSFDTIIFLDPVLHLGYLAKLTENTKAKLYLPPKTPFSYSAFAKIDLAREVFANYYRLFELVDKNKLTAQDTYSLFMLASKHLKEKQTYNYLQFMVCLYVFAELNILRLSEQLCSIEIISKQKTALTNSAFYNTLQLIKISKG